MEFSLPELVISSELIERIQFSVSSRNAEAKLAECAAHVFAAPYSDNPHNISWEYVSSGVACLLRNRELSKNGRKYMWTVNLCLYNASYGVLVWKAKLLQNSDFTAVADNFHVFALGEVNVLIGLMFSNKEKACELNTTYTKWHQERMRDDGKKGFVSTAAQSGNEPARFRKEMISKPCNFQHIQGTQAIDECVDMERIKADIIAALFGLGTKAGRSEADSEATQNQKSKKKKKKDPVKQRLQFKEIVLPQAQSVFSPPPPPVSSSPTSPGALLQSPVGGYTTGNDQMPQQDSQPTSTATPTSGGSANGQFDFEMANGYQDSSSSGHYQDRGRQDSAQQLVPDPMEQLLSEYSGDGHNDRSAGQPVVKESRVVPESIPNFQNPASPAYQEYDDSQGSYSYSADPPRLEMDLEKEFAESMLFKSSIMTAN